MFGEGVLRFVLVPVPGTPRRDPADLDRSLRSFFAQSALAQLLHRLVGGFEAEATLLLYLRSLRWPPGRCPSAPS